MITALLVSSDPAGSAVLSADLTSVGIHVLGAVGCDALVREALKQAPDVVVCWEPVPGEALWRAAEALSENASQALVLFTLDADAAKIERALRAGIHEVVIDGHGAARLRGVLQTAIARCKLDAERRAAMAELSERYEERKLVDRAKGLLMGVRGLSEDEAFRTLRSAAMHSSQRIGQVAQQMIAGARSAEAVNRAGQLRMLSQRIVKLQALRLAGGTGEDVQAAQAMLQVSIDRADDTLAFLQRQLSDATFGDLVEALLQAWSALKSSIHGNAGQVTGPAALADADERAEQLLGAAERLTAALELAGVRPTLAVINACGRQRMLSQRLAKQALLGTLLDEQAADRVRAAARATMEEFEAALQLLRRTPLSDEEIRASMEAATHAWHALLAGAAQAASESGRAAIAQKSEALLELFEGLTQRYERSMQVLLGEPRADPRV